MSRCSCGTREFQFIKPLAFLFTAQNRKLRGNHTLCIINAWASTGLSSIKDMNSKQTTPALIGSSQNLKDRAFARPFYVAKYKLWLWEALRLPSHFIPPPTTHAPRKGISFPPPLSWLCLPSSRFLRYSHRHFSRSLPSLGFAITGPIPWTLSCHKTGLVNVLVNPQY